MNKMILFLLTLFCMCFSSSVNAAFYNAVTDEEITEFAEGESIYFKACFTAPEDGKAAAIMASYNDDGRLVECKISDGIDMVSQEKAECKTESITASGCEMISVYIWNGTDSMVPVVGETYTIKRAEQKFLSGFPDVTGYIYRVGNANSVKLGSLFKAVDGAAIDSASVEVSVSAAIDGSDVTGVYTKNDTDWKNGTLRFSSTGPVIVRIKDKESKTFATKLEIVDAVNATSATSAKSNNVVLLNDCGFSTLEVSGGHTVYGNGFMLKCTNDVAATNRGYSFIEMYSGTLDNVRVVCPDFSHSILYETNKDDGDNPTDSTGRRYYNIRSAVMMSGNSRVLNSYVSGGRAALYVTDGNSIVDNTTVVGGAAANIHLGAANSLLLKDTRLLQKPTPATVNDTTKTVMGFSVLTIADIQGNATPITLEGDFVQYAWINKEYEKYVPGAGQQLVDIALGKKDYLHKITYDDDIERDSLNLGFAYMPDSLSAEFNVPVINDNRSNKAEAPYDIVTVSAAQVYSYINTAGTSDAFKKKPEYISSAYGDTYPCLTFRDTDNTPTLSKSYNTSGEWEYKLTVNLDDGDYNFSFDKLGMKKYGRELEYTVYDSNGEAVDKAGVIALTDSDVRDYSLKTAENIFIDESGNLTDVRGEYTIPFSLVATKTVFDAPSVVAAEYEAGLCVADGKGGNWQGAAPALEGISVRYWSVDDKEYKTVKLSDYTPETVGKQNGTNRTWTYEGTDFSLTVTGGQVHNSNNVYAMPVVVNCNGVKKLYFVASSSNGLVRSGNTARSVPVDYVFEDKNGRSYSFSHSWSVAEDAENEYSYTDFCNGILTAATTGGGGCVSGDTLVTLADMTKKRIDEITYADKLLVWDFYEGKYTAASPAIIFNHGMADNTVIKLGFSDGTTVKAVNLHQFLDADEKCLVTLTAETVNSFIGHEFIKADGGELERVKLVACEVTKEHTAAYGIISSKHYNIITEGMLSCDFELPDVGLFTYFDIGDGMRYDTERMNSDIEKYGLYSYEDFKELLTYEQFEAFNVKNMKVAVGKGKYTYEGIVGLIRRYLNN